MVKDIVCDKSVSEDSPYKTHHGDRMFYFCSQVCETSFINNPTKYIEKAGGAIGSTEGSPKITEEGKTISSRS